MYRLTYKLVADYTPAIETGVLMLRTHTINELCIELDGQQVALAGWVQSHRDHGGLVFVDLRDRYGIVQIVFDPATSKDAFESGNRMGPEDVIRVTGKVQRRPHEMINSNLTTGEFEIIAEEAEILNPSRSLPFAISGELEVSENLRLRYRYLDLRRPRMHKNLYLRHCVARFIRDWLSARGFWEVETPLLLKSTTGGAREILVPSRLHPGKFYALAQSPQQVKQLLMIAGVDRYFQIARCFRDEDPRNRRQIEFTALDLEMAFVEEEDIIQLSEALVMDLVREFASDKQLSDIPFPRLTYGEIIDKYGTDRPDLRFGLELIDLSDTWKETDCRMFNQVLANGGQVKGIRAPGLATYSRKQIARLEIYVKHLGAEGLSWIKVKAGYELQGNLTRFLIDGADQMFLTASGAEPGDLVLIVADMPNVVAKVLARLRSRLGHQLGLCDPEVLAFAWISGFPLFKWDVENDRWKTFHQPFTAPKDVDLSKLDIDPGSIYAREYTLVVNGQKPAGGTIRIYRRDVQQRILNFLVGSVRAKAEFEHILEALEYGAPPHGGISFGLDVLLRIITGDSSIREVIAFPKTTSGVDPLLNIPSEVGSDQLAELHIKAMSNQ